jgi:hypothetical protein
MDTSGANGFHLTHSTHQIDGTALAGVRSCQDRHPYSLIDHLDTCHLLLQRDEANVRDTWAAGKATDDIDSLETRLLNTVLPRARPMPPA